MIRSLSSIFWTPRNSLSNYDPGVRPQPLQQMQHRRFRHRDAAGGRLKIVARQMQEHRAAPPCGARAKIVIDLDDEIVEMVLAPQAVAAAVAVEPHRLVVVSVARILAPRIFGRDGTDRQKGARLRVAVGAPPQLARVKYALRRPTVTLALVGPDAATAERHRDGPPARREPAPARISCGGADGNRRKRPMARNFVTNDWNKTSFHRLSGFVNSPSGDFFHYRTFIQTARNSGVECGAVRESLTAA